MFKSVHDLRSVSGSHNKTCSNVDCEWDPRDENSFPTVESWFNEYHRVRELDYIVQSRTNSFGAVYANTDKLVEVPFPKEVRSTSSTGGQKGVKLERFDLIPVGPLTALARHYGAGARKYDDNQWRKGYEYGKSIAALYRHLTKWQSGEDLDICANDPDGCQLVDSEGKEIDWVVPGKVCFNHTGNHHLDGVMWHAFTLREFVELKIPGHDDRYRSES